MDRNWHFHFRIAFIICKAYNNVQTMEKILPRPSDFQRKMQVNKPVFIMLESPLKIQNSSLVIFLVFYLVHNHVIILLI